MATVKTKVVGTKKYYYLQHTVRAAGRVESREKYLGTRLPKDLEAVRGAFVAEIYKERWYPKLDEIKKKSSLALKKTPKSALEKQAKTFSVKFTYDTNRIEGSKLTYRETADLLERGLTPRSKPADDVKEAEAHEKLFYEALAYGKDLSLQVTLYWHKKLLESTKPDVAGKIRRHQVAISGSRFMPPSPAEVPALLREFYRWYDGNKAKTHPVELAALAHLKLVTIHPFADGNGRMSRLVMNFVLNKHSYPLLNIPYENRQGYYNALERSQTKKNDAIFVQWLFKRYLREHAK